MAEEEADVEEAAEVAAEWGVEVAELEAVEAGLREEAVAKIGRKNCRKFASKLTKCRMLTRPSPADRKGIKSEMYRQTDRQTN